MPKLHSKIGVVQLSEIKATAAAVSAFVSVTCLYGSEVEPQEIPLRTQAPIDSFLLMSASAILYFVRQA